MNRSLRARTLAGSLLVVLALAACTQGDSDDDAPGAGVSAEAGAYAPDATGDSSDDNTLTDKTNRPPDELAPTRITPVKRPGTEKQKRVRATKADFTQKVSYSDGVELDVLGIDQRKVAGRGPGVLSGPMTSLRLKLTNGSSKTVELDGVVVTAVYGDPARIARPVYADGDQDLAGAVKPGKTRDARYSFSVPRSDLTDVSVHIDFDSRHAIGVFSGSTTEN